MREIKAWFKKTGLTQAEADKRYLQLSGGVLTDGNYKVNLFFSDEEMFEAPFEVSSKDGNIRTAILDGYIYFYTRQNGKTFRSIIENGDGKILVCQLDDDGNDRPIIMRGVADPEQDTDAANKAYVDETVENAMGDIAAILDSINGEVA